ncbi:hypothetical protein Sango_0806700 [Sesamum angolense]|uniref:Uncharacterized protein n=1 Tax=Sesamum angolense TaxID=2727404 RepID=A0AAE1X3D3_9LAMI|nr:hypothetical protein Sango_0806700 [Sesamum angolense]
MVFAVPFPQYNPLDEPSPLGLRLRKSPSLLDLIQMRLSQESSPSVSVTSSEVADSGNKKDVKGSTAQVLMKIEGSNFPASLLRIGSFGSMCQGMKVILVAKCFLRSYSCLGSSRSQLPAGAIGSPISVFQDAASPAAAQLSVIKFGTESLTDSTLMDTQAIEGNRMGDEQDSGGRKSWESLKRRQQNAKDMLENIAQVMLSDNHCATGLDEKSLMKKVNSLCCLLQDPVIASSSQVDGENRLEVADRGKNVYFDLMDDSTHEKANNITHAPEGNLKDGPGCKQAPSMTRKDSFGDLLLHLPRIASLPKFPKFLFGIAEDDEYQAT